MKRTDEESVVVRGRGRPKKRDDNSARFELRLSRDEVEMLKHMEIESDKSRSEIVRKALALYYKANYGRW